MILAQPSIVNNLLNIEVVEGGKLELPVRISDCYPVPTSEWTKDGQLFNQDSNHLIEKNNSEYKLIVLNVSESDSGKYAFKSTNELGSVETSCQASILVKPVFLKQIEQLLTKNVNSSFTWDFEVKSKPISTFKILKDNKDLRATDRITVEKLEGSEYGYTLNVKNVDASDSGTYKIIATNKCGSATSNEGTLVVTGSACIVKKPNAHVFVVEKKSVKVEFEVAGVPMPTIEWFKNGQPLGNEPRLKVDCKRSVHILSFENVLMEDAAEFTLKAKNDSGEVSESFSLVIQSKFLIYSR